MQSQDPDNYDPLMGIDLFGELGSPELDHQLQQQPQQHQQQTSAAFAADCSDASYAISLSPISACSSGQSPHSFPSYHQHQQYQHQQYQHQQQQAMPLFVEADEEEDDVADLLFSSLASVTPPPLPQPPGHQQQHQQSPQLLLHQQQQQLEHQQGDDFFYSAPPVDGASQAEAPPQPAGPAAVKAEPVAEDVGDGKGDAPRDSTPTRQRQRQPQTRERDDKICCVCGDRALGFNFDAVSCESCKAFFRRNAGKGVDALRCPYSGNCTIDVANRRYCKRCRLRKCFDVGMKKEYILTEQEKLEKRKKVDQNKLIRTLESLQLLPKDLPPAELAEREPLTEAELADVQFLLDCYASSEVVKVPERQGQHASSVDDLINFAELSVVRVVDMCKKLAEFQQLSQQDKMALLKGGSLELILLRGVISFDPERARFLDSADLESADADSMAGGDFLKAAGANGQAFLAMAGGLRSGLGCDRATLVLLLTVCVFSADRPGLSPEGRDLAEAAQVRYSLLLDRLLRTRLPVSEARLVYPQLLTQLAELRGLEKDFSDLMSLSDPRLVRPLMAEFLDIQEAVGSVGGGKQHSTHRQH